MSSERRELIWKLAEGGEPLSYIASLFDISKSTVNSTIRLIRKKKARELDPFHTAHRKGVPPLLSARAHRRLIRFAKKNQTATLKDLARKMSAAQDSVHQLSEES